MFDLGLMYFFFWCVCYFKQREVNIVMVYDCINYYDSMKSGIIDLICKFDILQNEILKFVYVFFEMMIYIKDKNFKFKQCCN